ncbi:MAG TPA: flagellar basal body rod protein FlgC [Candidatus Hydrogenedentes bacterium]|nr:flagellar basal body rod protein FlgC [Candidatus Hydrogenedentota bacterium]HOK89560.1 flagellar basal body rod protein FlgC [Candidatus Hydrogenedentota bacterium]
MSFSFAVQSPRDIAVEGLRAQRARMTLIANNLANINTTRTPEGTAFRRQLVLLRGFQARKGGAEESLGIRVKSVVSDPSPFKRVYEPGHPDADKDGYVSYPNIDVAVEMIDLIAAQRAYEANLSVIATESRIRQQALDLLQQ